MEGLTLKLHSIDSMIGKVVSAQESRQKSLTDGFDKRRAYMEAQIDKFERALEKSQTQLEETL